MGATSPNPLEALERASPALYALYNSHPTLQGLFTDYARKQGFSRPVENLATVVHELLHVDSAAHQGYYIDGVYYEPYLKREAWPSLKNSQVSQRLEPQEKQGAIYQFYALKTPENHLGNLVDEINAYGHVLPFVCGNEAESAGKQIGNLTGFLALTEGYFRILRTELPEEYRQLAGNQEARGVLHLVLERAWLALKGCGVVESGAPYREAARFLSFSR